MPKNESGEVNLNIWLPTRPWSISVGLGVEGLDEVVAKSVSEWSNERRGKGSCFLAGQVSMVWMAVPGRVVRAVQVNGEINPEHASYCSDASAKRLLYRLTRVIMGGLLQDRAWIRYNGESMAVTSDWLDKYFLENPSPTPTSA